MSSVCWDASCKTWAPLTDRFIDERLLEMFPVFNQAQLSFQRLCILGRYGAIEIVLLLLTSAGRRHEISA